MNSLFTLLGLQLWKPVLTALVLPPVPLLLMVLIGARLILPRRILGWLLLLMSVLLLWFSACTGSAQLLSHYLLHPPPALSADRVKELKAQGKSGTAIVVLGGGLEPFAAEYGVSDLSPVSLERLRYGVWLGRQTGIPVAFSGGVGWGQPDDGKSEAKIAAQIAAAEFGQPLNWVETRSRDTRENALLSVALLKPAGIKNIVLVTHVWHMPRAVNAFESAAGDGVRIEAAPMGMALRAEQSALDWIPTTAGATNVRHILRELLGRLMGA